MPWNQTPPGSRRLPRNWNQLRGKVIQRDEVCAACGAPGSDVDHIVAHADGGTDHLDNLQYLCKPCHMRKLQRESAAARKRNGNYITKYRPREKHPGILD